MGGYFFVAVSTYKPVHGECSRVAVGSGGLWLSDHTSNSCTLYTRGTNLGGDPGPATLQLVLLFQPPIGIMLWGGVRWEEDMSWVKTSQKAVLRGLCFKLLQQLLDLLPFIQYVNPDWYRVGNEVTNKSICNIQAANMQSHLVFWITVLGNPVREERQ
jgi:hypothetical protein